jgi:hypothetical protein
MQQRRNLTQYDLNSCGTVLNITIFDYKIDGNCDYCTPNWILNSSWGECTLLDLRFKNYYDFNNCGEGTAPLSINESCNYCSYNNIFTPWSSWQDEGSCLPNNSQMQNRTRVEYDSNYETCYLLTLLGSDLWNFGNNITYFDNRYVGCDFCTPNLINTTIGNWVNISCLSNNIMNQSRSWVQYDSNYCNEVGNITFIEYKNDIYCDYNWMPYFTSTPVTTAYPNIVYNYDANAYDADGDNLTYSLIYWPSGMTINPYSGLITWTASDYDKGNCYYVSVQVTDGYYNVTQNYNLCVDYPSSEKYPRRKIFIENIRTNNVVYDFVKPGGNLDVDISFENMGVYDIKKSTIRVTVEELGISMKIGPFNGPDTYDEMLKRIPMVIPCDAKPGVYTMRITLTTDNEIKRVRHRDFRVV